MVPLKNKLHSTPKSLFPQPALKLKQPSWIEIHRNLETYTSDPLKYKMGNPLLYQYVCENPSEYKRLSFAKETPCIPVKCTYLYC